MMRPLITVTSLICAIGAITIALSGAPAKSTWLVRDTDSNKTFEVTHNFGTSQPGDTVDLPPFGYGLTQTAYPEDKVYVLMKKLD